MTKRTGSKQRLLSNYSHFLLAALLVFGPRVVAQTTSVVLTGVGDGATLGDVYVDPYTATVGGVADMSVICDDWSNNSYLDESWEADVISISTLTTTSNPSPMFGDSPTLYNELAWLGSQLLANPTNSTVQTEISFAMWDLTYGVNGTQTETPAPLTYLSENLSNGTSNTEYQATLNLISEAQNEGTFNASGWEILTPLLGTSNPPGDGTPQEFLVYSGDPMSMPEPPGVILFGVEITGLLSLGYVFRRRFLRSIS